MPGGSTQDRTSPQRRALPTGVVTFVFTDIEGSTRLLRTLGPRLRPRCSTPTTRSSAAPSRRTLAPRFAPRGIRSSAPSRAQARRLPPAWMPSSPWAPIRGPRAARCGRAWACTRARPRRAVMTTSRSPCTRRPASSMSRTAARSSCRGRPATWPWSSSQTAHGSSSPAATACGTFPSRRSSTCSAIPACPLSSRLCALCRRRRTTFRSRPRCSWAGRRRSRSWPTWCAPAA